MKSINDILKYIGYIIIVPSYIAFFALFLIYLAYFCSQILLGDNISNYFYNTIVQIGLIIPNNIVVNLISSMILLAIFLSFIFTVSYMIEILNADDHKNIASRTKLDFHLSFAIFILLNLLSMIFRNYYKNVPAEIPNGNIIPFAIIIWILIVLISRNKNKTLLKKNK